MKLGTAELLVHCVLERRVERAQTEERGQYTLNPVNRTCFFRKTEDSSVHTIKDVIICSMTLKHPTVRDRSDDLTLALERAPADSPQFSPEYQGELSRMLRELRGTGLEVRPRIFFMDAVDAGGGLTGELTVAVRTLGPVIGTVVGSLGTWLASRSGRKIRIKVDGIEVEANSMKQLDEALKRVNQIKRENEPKRII